MKKGWPEKNKTNTDTIYAKKDTTIKVRLIDAEPELYYTHYIDRKSVKCDGKDCQYCVNGEKLLEKGSILVLDLETDTQKNLKGSSALFRSLKEVLDICGGKDGNDFTIKTTGDKSDRRYTIVPSPTAIKQKPSTEEAPF